MPPINTRSDDLQRLLNFTHGLSGVQRATDLAPLPDEGAVPAQDTRPAIQLDALFERPSFDDLLDEAVAPPLADPGVLEPAAFAAALDDAQTMLLQLSTGRDGAVFADALGVLEGAQADRAVLDTARRALMRG